MFNMRQRAGFTLMELLVVVSIVVLLVAMLLPGLAKAREGAFRIKCLNGARQATLAMLNYAMEQNDYLPNGNAQPFHATLVDMNFATQEVFTSRGGCPHGLASFNAGAGPDYYFNAATRLTYGANSALVTGSGYYSGSWQAPGPLRLRSRRLERHANITPMVFDNHHAGSSAHVQSVNIRAMLGIPAYDLNPWGIGVVRHQGQGLNFAFADGAGRFVPSDQIWHSTPYNYYPPVAGLLPVRWLTLSNVRLDE